MQRRRVTLTITWTSAQLTLLRDQDAIKIEVKKEVLADVQEAVDGTLKFNAIELSDLRTLAGQATCISSLPHVWRPFVSMIWAPLYNPRSPELDRKILRVGAEGSEGQQAGEALAMLVALRLWKARWMNISIPRCLALYAVLNKPRCSLGLEPGGGPYDKLRCNAGLINLS